MTIKKLKFLKTKKRKIQIGVGIAFVLVVIAVFAGRDAAPGNPLYPMDRKFENIVALTKKDIGRQIDFELGLAKERLNEMKVVNYKYDHTSFLVEDYKVNLENLVHQFRDLGEEGTGDDEMYAQFDKLITHTNTFERDIKTYRQNVEDNISNQESRKHLKGEFNIAISLTYDFQDMVFDIAIRDIEDNIEFNKYAKGMIDTLDYYVVEQIEYAQIDTATLVNQASEEDIAVLSEMINDLSEKFHKVHDGRARRSNLENYLQYQELKKDIKTLSDKIVEVNHKNLKIVE